MIGALSNGNGVGSASSLYYPQQTRGINGLTALASSAGGQGGGGGFAQSSANISGPGQLLSNLQQLQTQNPTQFQQLVSQIANQLQTAAQQAQGPLSSFLSNLSTNFQSVASGGNLSQLQPQQQQEHHHHHAHQAYGQETQNQPQGVAALAPSSGSQSSGSATVQQLFSTISTEVSQALAS
jgi:hypothetical protein